MKPFGIRLLFLTLALVTGNTGAKGQSAERIEASFDWGWRFFQGDPEKAGEPDFDDRSWRLLDLPHDWSIEGAFDQNAPAGGSGGYLPAGVGWYRKHFTVKKNDLNMDHRIVFDGVYMNSDVWLNGKHLGNYPFGYNSFYYDLEPFLKEGENILAVRVDNSKQPNSRWYSGSGIYRHVWMVRTNQLHISQWGIYVTTPEITERDAAVEVQIRFENGLKKTEEAVIISYVLDDKGTNTGQTESTVKALPGKENLISQKIKVTSPRLWSIEDPVMYNLVTKIIVSDKLVDEVITPFGIRTIYYDVDKGFFLNGKKYKDEWGLPASRCRMPGRRRPAEGMGTEVGDT